LTSAVITAAATVAAFLALAAQEQTPTFRATTRLVELNVTALDKKGQAVTDLRLQDFTIQENGKLRPITFFKYDGGLSVEPAALPLPAGLFTNRVEFTPGPPRNITALVLDELNTPAQSSMRVRAMAMRYLKALAPRTRMAVFQMSGHLRVLQDFTDDADALRGRIEKAAIAMPLQVEGDFDKAIIEAEQFVAMFAEDRQLAGAAVEIARNGLEVEMMANAQSRAARLEKTLAAMESLGQHLAGVPGRKNLVWIGGGISMISVTGALGTGPHGSIDSSEDKVKRTSQKLAQQGIVLYIVDAKGLALPTSMTAESQGTLPVRGRGRFEAQQDAERMSDDTFPTMDLMASTTGGRYLYNTNDLAEGFKKAASDLEGSYTLGFYVSEEPDSKWHDLKASVKRSGVTLRHRKGYLAEPVAASPAPWTNDMAMAVIANPMGSSAVQMTAYCGPAADGEPGMLQVNLQIEAGSLRFQATGQELKAQIQVIFAERAPNGNTRLTTDTPTVKIAAQNWETAQQEGLHYGRRLKPAPDAVSLRVIVRDMITGHYGTLDVPLKKGAPARGSDSTNSL
jgi:VWFA-related protein